LKLFYAQMEIRKYINVLDWSSQLPMRIIENVWTYIKLKLRDKTV